MAQRFEGHFQGYDECELFFQTWTPDSVRGTLVLTHGMAEHSECYHPVAKVLVEDGWQVYAWDLRGHGRSEGKRGYVADFSEYVKDFDRFLQMINQQAKPKTAPVLLAHSMGALVTLRYLQSYDCKYSALVLSSPCVGLSIPVPKFKEGLAKIAYRWMPSLTLHNEIQYSDLTHLQEMQESYRRDTLRHDKISPGLFLTMTENFPLAIAQADKIQNPVLELIAGDDRLVSTAAAKELYDGFTNKKNQLILYPESFHEIFNDLERDKAFADIKKFINPYLGA
jgi:alpha-beta hydrolase superfamily lysophospholipase